MFTVSLRGVHKYLRQSQAEGACGQGQGAENDFRTGAQMKTDISIDAGTGDNN